MNRSDGIGRGGFLWGDRVAGGSAQWRVVLVPVQLSIVACDTTDDGSVGFALAALSIVGPGFARSTVLLKPARLVTRCIENPFIASSSSSTRVRGCTPVVVSFFYFLC